MRLFRTVAGLCSELERHWQQRTIGLVPTMGALHSGHLSLMARAVAENEVVVTSIFVNPLQFEPGSDLAQYPRTLEQDCQLCEQMGVQMIFAPTVGELYGEKTTTQSSEARHCFTQVVPPESMLEGLCAPHRPGHFQGVATIVTKLLNIVQPTNAYFGEKDAQQLAIVRRLVSDLNFPVTIRACPIIRDPSGLAYSSRNQYLTAPQKAQAALLFQSLQAAHQAFKAGEREAQQLITLVKQELARDRALAVEYVELVDPDTLQPLARVENKGLLAIAAYVGSTRLIDNVLLRQRRPIVAIDGPAGAGKSTVTRRVAQGLGLMHLDTGAMYRALTWLVLQAGIPLDDQSAIAELASQAQIQLIAPKSLHAPPRVQVDGQEVTEAIRSAEVTAHVSEIAAQSAVRRELVKQQQRWGEKGGIVAEGRDIGTAVFPDAELKIFLTASLAERARRRRRELIERGIATNDLSRLEQEIEWRDTYDSRRQVSPLRKAPDAIEIQTDNLTVEEVIARIIELYYQRGLS